MFAKKFSIIVIALALLAVPMVQTAHAAPPSQDTGVPRTLTVTGYGTAYGAPDVVQVGLGVDASDADILAAMNDVTNRMNAVMQALEASGVDVKDIRTDSFSVYQDYKYGQPAADPMQQQDAQPFYRVSTTVSVTVRQTDKIADLLAAAVNAGANVVNYIQFNIEDRTALESQARTLAVADARARAEELAGLMGLTVGEALQVTEGGSMNMPYYSMGGGGGGGGYAVAAPPPISQGTLSVDMSVTVTFAVSSAS
jgi:uncharacterized protein YggE